MLYSLLFTSVSGQASQTGSCISLKGSLQCPEYSAFYIESSTLFQNVSQFDDYLSNYATPRANVFLKDMFHCASWNEDEMRYPISFLCGFIVYASQANFGCNSNQNIPQLCKSSATAYVDTMNEIINNPKFCPNVTGLPQQYLNYTSNLGETSDCLIGFGKEKLLCGFQDINSAQAYCAVNKAERCCSSVSLPSSSSQVGLSSTAFTLLISAIVTMVILIGGGIFYICYRRNKKNDPYQHKAYKPGSSDTLVGSRPLDFYPYDNSMPYRSASVRSQKKQSYYSTAQRELPAYDEDKFPIHPPSPAQLSNNRKSSYRNDAPQNPLAVHTNRDTMNYNHRQTMREPAQYKDRQNRQTYQPRYATNEKRATVATNGRPETIQFREHRTPSPPKSNQTLIQPPSTELLASPNSPIIKLPAVYSNDSHSRSSSKRFNTMTSQRTTSTDPLPIKVAEQLALMKCEKPYDPEETDELSLALGDIIYVKLTFDDGWCQAINLTTKQDGFCPHVCLAPLYGQERASQLPQRTSRWIN
ncbi:hypothetical protein HK103_001490 [Boothiomyces macroporosus]|uniref:SH3 domain-containing protein n=1 Tax=Boothiomyces macroporosus TaxID=261099 RepID=A0AAD5Y9W0_9FUNG|nr:hypothetical protein HK103_001490 [Boothiomyces macroporosus]